MSAIAGALHLDGAPVDRDLLQRMADQMIPRAPDGTGLWSAGPVGLAQARLTIDGEPEEPVGPYSTDGQTWIVADARIDGRDELVPALRAAGRSARVEDSSTALILEAYRAFGVSCLDHLIGDFAFALWDAATRTLFCARDHFGVRPFFYTRAARGFQFASDIFSLLQCPDVTPTLDENAIADFLFFGCDQDEAISAYRDIRRLPAAHCLLVASTGVSMRRYWTPPIDAEVRYRRDAEYTEHFFDLFQKAVADRSQAARAGILMSGGMDSTAVAAVAARLSPRPALTAFTMTSERLLPDDAEGLYAGLVAADLDISHIRVEIDDVPLLDRLDQPALWTAEPPPNPLYAVHYDNVRRMQAADARVLFTGYGADIVFTEFYGRGTKTSRLQRVAGDLWRHMRATGSLRQSGLRAALRHRPTPRPEWLPEFPEWLAPDFVERAKLRDRWAEGWRKMDSAADQATLLRTPSLSSTFTSAEQLRAAVVCRHPFFDVRLMTFTLGVPSYVKFDKRPLRDSMIDRLPAAVRTRPKTTVVGDLTRAKLLAGLVASPLASSAARLSDRYVLRTGYELSLNRYLTKLSSEETWSSWQIVAPLALQAWLNYSRGD